MITVTSDIAPLSTANEPQRKDVKYFKIRLNLANEQRKNIIYKFNTGKERNRYITFNFKCQ